MFRERVRVRYQVVPEEADWWLSVMLNFLALAVLIVFTMAFSYLHGADKVGKGWLIAAEALLGAGVGLLLAGWFGLLGALISPVFWFLFRTSSEARAALDYMARHPWGKLVKIWQAYLLPIGFCSTVISVAAGFCGQPFYLLFIPLCWAPVPLVLWLAKRYRIDAGETDRENRWPMETFGVGLCGGINVASALFVAAEVVKAAGYGV